MRTAPLLALFGTAALAAGCGPRDETVALRITPVEPDPFTGLQSVELVIGTDHGDVVQSYDVAGTRPDMRVQFDRADVQSVTLRGYVDGCVRAEGRAASIATEGDTPLLFLRRGAFHVLTDIRATTLTDHTTTALLDGRVLVVTSSRAELFDPGSGIVADVGPTVVPRSGHSAVRLASGQVLVVGGAGVGQTAVARFDPAAASDGLVDTGIALVHGRNARPVLLEVATNRVLVVGGNDGTGTIESEVIDLDAGTSTITGDAFAERRDHASITTAAHEAVIVGGRRGTVVPLVERTTDGVSLTAEALGIAREDATLVEIPARQAVAVIGGHDGSDTPLRAMEAIRSGARVDLPPLDTALAVSRAAAVSLASTGDGALVLGGHGTAGASDRGFVLEWPTDDPASLITASTHPDDATMTPISLVRARESLQAVRLENGDILVTGGVGVSGAAVEPYEIYRPPLPCP